MIVLPDTDAAARRPLVFVTVGSDYHPFSRLVSWMDAWLADGGSQRAQCIMQFGAAAAPVHAHGEAFLPHDEILALMRRATAVVTQGGPMTMIEARRQGRLPIAVPRTRALGEVVDDHQHAFCRHMAQQEHAAVATDEASLRRLLDEAIAVPHRYVVDPDLEGDRIGETVAAFTAIADRLTAQRRVPEQRVRRLTLPRRGAPLTSVSSR